jgi:hypothetical protein
MLQRHIFTLVEDIQNETTGAFTRLNENALQQRFQAWQERSRSAEQAYGLVRVIT